MKVGQWLDGQGCDTHSLLLRVDCGSSEATCSRLFPVHRPDAAIVTGQSNPNSGGEERRVLDATSTNVTVRLNSCSWLKS